MQNNNEAKDLRSGDSGERSDDQSQEELIRRLKRVHPFEMERLVKKAGFKSYEAFSPDDPTDPYVLFLRKYGFTPRTFIDAVLLARKRRRESNDQ